MAIIFISLCIISLFLIDTINQKHNNIFVQVEVEGKEYIYPIDKDADYRVTGSIGETTIRVENSGVSFINAPCLNKTCIKIGEIHNYGQSAACLPNRVLITIQGEQNSEVDVVTF